MNLAVNEFAQNWPKSPQLAELRMKLGQRFYASEDFPNAQRQFEILRTETPKSPLVEPALFFAGKAAMSLLSDEGADRAIELWGEVAKGRGELAFHARYYQAEAKRRMGRSEEAISVLEGILQSDPPPPQELRWESLVARAQILLKKGNEDDVAMSDAQLSLRGIVDGAEAAGDEEWYHRASYLLMQAYEVDEAPSEAIAVGYDAVVAGGEAAPSAPALFWLYRSGFQTVTLLSAAEKWDAAAKIADRLAKIPGNRAEEAFQLSEKIRLEHFIWDDDTKAVE
jgi:tetratricopeptide (TPR) repeat protein